jgi:hypothetical protein
LNDLPFCTAWQNFPASLAESDSKFSLLLALAYLGAPPGGGGGGLQPGEGGPVASPADMPSRGRAGTEAWEIPVPNPAGMHRHFYPINQKSIILNQIQQRRYFEPLLESMHTHIHIHMPFKLRISVLPLHPLATRIFCMDNAWSDIPCALREVFESLLVMTDLYCPGNPQSSPSYTIVHLCVAIRKLKC